VRLVDDDDVVFGKHVNVGRRIDGEQRVVGHHDVRLGGRLPGLLGEAPRAERAARRADALLRADRDLPPGRLGHARDHFIPVPRRGDLGPLVQPLHLTAQRRGRPGIGRVEQRVLGVLGLRVRPAALTVQAQVVAAALQDREQRLPAEQRLEREGQARQVTVDQLALQRDGGRGHQHRGLGGHRVPYGRDQVGQRLPGTGAGLDGKVLTGLDGSLNGLGHRDLPGPLLAADAGHGRREQLGHGRDLIADTADDGGAAEVCGGFEVRG
jgi:hypothetical protein